MAVLTSVPVCIVEIGFASNPLTSLASVVWTDVTTYVLGFDTKAGRQHELNRVEASTASITLDNKDRRFDPTNTSGPYNPNVLPMKRVRIRATWNSVTYPVYCGFIESWPLSWPDVTDSYVTIHCSDVLGKVLALKNIQNPYLFNVMANSPTVWYRMSETSAVGGAVDSGPSGYFADYQGTPTFGGVGPVNDGTNTAVLFTATTNDGIVTPPLAGVSGTAAFSAECWFNTTAGTYLFQQAGGTGTGWRLSIDSGLGYTLVFTTFDRSATRTLNPASAYNDGKWHHVVATRTAGGTLTLIVDGVSVATATYASSNIVQAGVTIGNTGAGPTWVASMAHAALYGTALTTAQALVHKVSAAAWANDLSGARITHLLDAIGWPSADRNIEAGASVLQADPTPGSVLTDLLDTANSENGLLFQGPDGVINFYQRSHLWTVAASTTSQATFGDGPGELPYVLQGIAPVMDDLDLWNDVQAQRTGGVQQEAQDAASQTTYGTRTLSVTNLKLSADSDVLNRAQYDLNRYKAPLTRLRSFTVTAWSDATNLFPQVLGRLLWDRVTFARRPVGGGPVFSQPSVIEGIEHHFTKAQWQTTFHLSPTDASGNLYLVLNDGARGVLGTNLVGY